MNKDELNRSVWSIRHMIDHKRGKPVFDTVQIIGAHNLPEAIQMCVQTDLTIKFMGYV